MAPRALNALDSESGGEESTPEPLLTELPAVNDPPPISKRKRGPGKKSIVQSEIYYGLILITVL